ncbi:MAG TPA: CBS domain-containing protein [Acidobacteriaceae bacterium]|nr:CBS domain-containing protein [Acidobacteriaceae bacterium]
MRGWSIPLGRWFGVELRIHTFFLLLAPLCIYYASLVNATAGTGIALWILVLAAVAVREFARLCVAAWFGLRLRTILLLPIGGLFAYADPDSQDQAANGPARFALAFAGPLANLLTALVLAAGALGASGSLNLLALPLITPAGLLRSFLWIQAFLGVLHLAPAYPLDAGRLLRHSFTRAHGPTPASRALIGLGQFLAVAAIFAGFFLHDPVLPTAGFFLFIGAQLEDQGVFFQSVVDTVVMREVMLTDYATLSPSDTLADALSRSVHSLQEDFPVVRDRRLVGIVNRQRIVDQLRVEGNGYIQGIMSRSFQVARPEDTLGAIIRRLTAGKGMSLIPVAEGERIVGMVSVQNLMTAMSLLSEQRRHERES